MSNDIAKALKQKTDAMLRLQGQSQKPVVYENVDGSYTAPEKSDYTAVLAQGKNIKIITSGNIKTIEAIMNLLKGDNITISAPDANGAVTITGTISGKGINIVDFTGKNGYVLTYDSASDKFILAAQSGSLPQATETVLGGIKAKAKTTETSEVSIDPATGKLYGPAPDAAINGLPQGGTTGQVLSKIDGTEYNAQWVNPPSAGGTSYANAIDTPPATPNTKDDEFNGSSLDPKWSWINKGQSLASVYDKAVILDIDIGQVSRGIVQPVPSSDFIAIAKVNIEAWVENYYLFGIGFFNSANNRVLMVNKRHHNGVVAVGWCKATTTAWGSDYSWVISSVAEMYVKIQKIGTILKLSYSLTGRAWQEVLSEDISVWMGAVTDIGLIAFRNNTNAAHKQICICDWFRVTAP